MCETIKLNNATLALQNLDFVAFRRSAPLCAGDVCVIKSIGISAASWLPSKTSLSESELAGLLRQVEVDVIEILPGVKSACAPRPQARNSVASAAAPPCEAVEKWYLLT